MSTHVWFPIHVAMENVKKNWTYKRQIYLNENFLFIESHTFLHIFLFVFYYIITVFVILKMVQLAPCSLLIAWLPYKSFTPLEFCRVCRRKWVPLNNNAGYDHLWNIKKYIYLYFFFLYYLCCVTVYEKFNIFYITFEIFFFFL